jgi:hypothetical protein
MRDEYLGSIAALCERLDAGSFDAVLAVASLPEQVRGLMSQLATGPRPARSAGPLTAAITGLLQ